MYVKHKHRANIEIEESRKKLWGCVREAPKFYSTEWTFFLLYVHKKRIFAALESWSFFVLLACFCECSFCGWWFLPLLLPKASKYPRWWECWKKKNKLYPLWMPEQHDESTSIWENLSDASKIAQATFPRWCWCYNPFYCCTSCSLSLSPNCIFFSSFFLPLMCCSFVGWKWGCALQGWIFLSWLSMHTTDGRSDAIDKYLHKTHTKN